MKQLFATSILTTSIITVCSMCSTGTDNNNGNNNYKKAIFVTESTYDGDLETAAKNLGYVRGNKESGISAADYLCNKEAESLGYIGEFKALINSTAESQNIYLNVINNRESTPYYNIIESGKLESTVLATSVKYESNMTDMSDYLTFTPGAKFFNRGESTNWVGYIYAVHYTCNNWTSNESDTKTYGGTQGSGKLSDSWRTLAFGQQLIEVKCSQKASLVCVQQ